MGEAKLRTDQNGGVPISESIQMQQKQQAAQLATMNALNRKEAIFVNGFHLSDIGHELIRMTLIDSAVPQAMGEPRFVAVIRQDDAENLIKGLQQILAFQRNPPQAQEAETAEQQIENEDAPVSEASAVMAHFLG